MKYSTKIRQISASLLSSRICNLIFVFFITINYLYAQTPAITSITPSNPNQVEIIKADSLVGQNMPFMSVRRLMGNVALKQGTSLLYCNLAILNETTNILEAYGKVKIIQADTVTITGDTAYYFGNERKAKINGRVKLDDKTIILTTNKLDYDMNSRMAYYNTKGKIVDKKSTLTSQEAYYNT
jgi:lipopolysaccharide assembly outer membrane protein LptD (OstA)